MSKFAVTNTFVAGTTAIASQVNVNFNDILTILNNLEAGTDTWTHVKVISTDANPVDITSSAATTELSINNTATDGDPTLTFKFSGSTAFSLGVDDTDNAFKIGTTSITTALALSIPEAGGAVYFGAGTTSLPSISFSSDPNTGIYHHASADTFNLISNGSSVMKIGPDYVWTETDHHLLQNGSAAVPSLSFASDTDTGIFRVAENRMAVSLGGVSSFEFGTSNTSMLNLIPNSDNTYSLGANGSRWSAVWAANGTIQTSCSTTKINIESISEEQIKIPEAITFNRPTDTHNKPQLGFLADDLPEECFAVDEDGNRSTTDVYTSSVIGILCAAVKKLTSRIEALEK
jgi:hypothetical protein